MAFTLGCQPTCGSGKEARWVSFNIRFNEKYEVVYIEIGRPHLWSMDSDLEVDIQTNDFNCK